MSGRDARGNVYGLTALMQLTDAYLEAAGRDATARKRWNQLALESELELLERVVLLYHRLVPEQRQSLLGTRRLE